MKPPRIWENFSENSVRDFCERILKVLFSISFGNGTNPTDATQRSQNIKGVWLEGTTNAAPDTETAFDHKLGAVPVGMIVMSLDKGGVLYKGATAWDSTKVYIKSNVASVTFKVFLIGE